MAATIRLSQQHSCSFDHLVGARDQRAWNVDTDNLCRLQVDDELKLGRAQDRHICRLLALEDTAGIDAGQAKLVHGARSVAHQSADLDKITQVVDRRQRMARRLRDDLYTTVTEQALWTDEECIRALLHKAGECNIDLPTVAGAEKVDFPPDGRSRCLQIFGQGLGPRIARIDEHGEARGSRQQLMQETKPLALSLQRHGSDTGNIAARPIETGDETHL